MDAEDRSERQREWATLPEPIRLADTTSTHDVNAGQDSTWNVDYERYWAAQRRA
ncbi:hypothetical protein GCM10022222_68420 [Amycolatopsis ultiminotia]|uniref:Uncharacterized protein n=1 Tax=Amycolatopsis ultiminotia TaxID=543629 RepID=A0ABP6Y3K4_9PSEU